MGSSRCKTPSKKPHSGFNQTCNKGIDIVNDIITYMVNFCWQQWCITNNGQCVYAVFSDLVQICCESSSYLQDKSDCLLFAISFCAKFPFLPEDNKQT